MSKFNAVVLAVAGLGAYPIRLSECGALPMKNGAQVRVRADLAAKMLEAYAPYLVQVDGSLGEVESLKNGHWEPVSAAAGASTTAPKGEDAPQAGDAVDPAVETAGAEKTDEGKAQNRSMQGRTKTK